MRSDELQRLAAGVHLSVGDLAEQAGVHRVVLEEYYGGRRNLPTASRDRLAAAIRSHAAAMQRTADALERGPTAPAIQPPSDGHKAGTSKAKIAVGAVGLLMFIVGVRRFSPTGEPKDPAAE